MTLLQVLKNVTAALEKIKASSARSILISNKRVEETTEYKELRLNVE